MGTGTGGTSPTLFLSIDRQAQYGTDTTTIATALFNPGEGVKLFFTT
jgi:hypothetical protein